MNESQKTIDEMTEEEIRRKDQIWEMQKKLFKNQREWGLAYLSLLDKQEIEKDRLKRKNQVITIFVASAFFICFFILISILLTL